MDLLTVTVTEIIAAFKRGSLTSREITGRYLDQIAAHNEYLHAVIQTADREAVLSLADTFDDRRKRGDLAGPLHGVPILIKDNIATHPSLGFETTAGNWPLKASRPRQHARIVDRLLEAGAIIIGKANLSEMSFFKSNAEHLPSGWSAVGGQCQSAYVRGGIRPDDALQGHSNPGGSSTGSAVAVSAGFAPASIGTETFGSLVMPATRAALYTIKPSIGLVSQMGIVPISPLCDSAGPMTKSVPDLALILDVLTEPGSPGIPAGGYTRALGAQWSDLRVAALDPDEWKSIYRKEESAEAQMIRETNKVYDRIATLAKSFHRNVDLPKPKDLKAEREHGLMSLLYTDFKDAIEAYFTDLEQSPARTLSELIETNKKMADKEFPPGKESQWMLEHCLTFSLTPDQRKEALDFVRTASREKGIDMILKQYDCDVIIGPSDSDMAYMASASGYPICAFPLGTLDLNGRPFGLSALAGHHQEAKLIALMSAWESSFPKRAIPLDYSNVG